MNTWSVATVPYDAMHNNGFASQVRNPKSYKEIAAYASTILRKHTRNDEPMHLEIYNTNWLIAEVKTYNNKTKLIYDKDLVLGDPHAHYVLTALRNAIKSDVRGY